MSIFDLIDGCLDKIKKFNPVVNAFITIIEKEVLYKQAQILEQEIKQGKYRGPLHGIPFSIKDIFYVKGVRCTAGSKILMNYVPKTSATVVNRMEKAGAILIGTNNLNEFASGITGMNPFYGSSKNPWSISRISGGSSGGSAVAVATGMTLISLGTDTGGSVRVPSSLCGVVGLKPTFGRISKHNTLPLSPSLDHVGCITRSTWDAAAMMEHIAGWDPYDETSVNTRVPQYTKIIEKTNLKGIRIGVPKEYFCDQLHPEISGLFYNFVEILSSMKTIVVSGFKLHNTKKYYKSWHDIRLSEAADVHLKWLSKKAEEYSPEVRQMLEDGTVIPAVDYINSLRVIKKLKNEFLANFSTQKLDYIVVPTTIIPAPKFEEDTVGAYRNFELKTRQALLRNAIVFNSIGFPAISIPIGLTKDNMPVGAQIIGPPFKEEKVLSLAYTYELMNNSIDKFVPPL